MHHQLSQVLYGETGERKIVQVVTIKAEVHHLYLLDKEENDNLKAHLCYFRQFPHTTGQANTACAANAQLANRFA